MSNFIYLDFVKRIYRKSSISIFFKTRLKLADQTIFSASIRGVVVKIKSALYLCVMIFSVPAISQTGPSWAGFKKCITDAKAMTCGRPGLCGGYDQWDEGSFQDDENRTVFYGAWYDDSGSTEWSCRFTLSSTNTEKLARKPTENPTKRCSSIINMDERSLIENVRIYGTPFSLVYDSAKGPRQADFKASFYRHINEITAVTANLKGRILFSKTFLVGATDREIPFVWDGKDELERPIFVPAQIQVSYEIETPGSSMYKKISTDQSIGPFNARYYGLGGWMVSHHHYLDVGSDRIHLGSGSSEKANQRKLSDGTFAVMARDETEVYIFDAKGRHYQTRSPILGKVIYTFKYDTSNQLISITDGFGNLTRFERTSGKLSGIVGPYGQRTAIVVGANQYISKITDPQLYVYQATYHTGKTLLATFTEPGRAASKFTYTPDGYLETDLHPSGKYTSISTQKTGGNRKTSWLNAFRQSSSIEVIQDLQGEKEITTKVTPISTVVETYSYANYYNYMKSESALGTKTTNFQGNRFYQAVPTRENFINPEAGINATTSYYQWATLSNYSDPYSVTKMTWSTTKDNNKTETIFEQNQYVTTSPMGRTTSTLVDAFERPVSVKTPLIADTTFEYDLRGRLSKTSKGTTSKTLTYDTKGFLASETNAAGHKTLFENDNLGRPLKITLPDQRVVTSTFDGRGNLLSITPPQKPAHKMTYDSLNNMASYTTPPLNAVSETTLLTYDKEGRLFTLTRPDSLKVTNAYDSVTGLLKTETTPQGVRSYFYEPGTGNLSEASFNGTKVTLDWGGPYRISETQTYRDGVTAQQAYVYYPNGKIKDISVSGATGSSVITQSYNPDEQLTQVGAQRLDYNAQNGLLEKISHGSITTIFTHNDLGLIKSATTTYGTKLLYQYDLTYDLAGKIKTKKEIIQGVTSLFGYTYDSAGRLKTVTKGGVVISSYNYDGNSNLLPGKRNGANFAATYDDQDKILTFNNLKYGYNKNGEVTTITDSATSAVKTISYDVYGNVTGFKTASSNVVYTLDPFGRRATRTKNNALGSRHIYYDSTRLAAEFSSTGSLNKHFIYASQNHSPDYMIQGSNKFQFIKDNLGSVRLAVNVATGAIAQKITYDEWGKVIASTGLTFQPINFAGGVFDSETKLVRFGARSYDPETGRWLSKDPILFGGGDTNLYGYVVRDPVNLVDPNGKLPLWLVPTIGAAIGMASTAIGKLIVGEDPTIGDLALGAAGGAVATVGAGALALGPITCGGMVRGIASQVAVQLSSLATSSGLAMPGYTGGGCNPSVQSCQ